MGDRSEPGPTSGSTLGGAFRLLLNTKREEHTMHKMTKVAIKIAAKELATARPFAIRAAEDADPEGIAGLVDTVVSLLDEIDARLASGDPCYSWDMAARWRNVVGLIAGVRNGHYSHVSRTIRKLA
jgi:hypothetical protein